MVDVRHHGQKPLKDYYQGASTALITIRFVSIFNFFLRPILAVGLEVSKRSVSDPSRLNSTGCVWMPSLSSVGSSLWFVVLFFLGALDVSVENCFVSCSGVLGGAAL